jgi:hypothetical protein
VALLLIAAGIFYAPTVARAAGGGGPVECTNPNPYTGNCTVGVGGGGKPGGGGTGNGGGGKPAPCKAKDGTVVPCQNGNGAWWSNSLACYLTPVVPPPVKSDPIWAGHSTGAIYACGPLIGPPVAVWLPAPPGPVIDPAVLAQQAIQAMQLKAITIGIVPEPRPGSVGIIGLPTWMWAQNPGATTVGPITRTASAGGFTVSATAHVDRMVWRMGDGSTVTCMGPGTPYQDSFGRSSSPDCGHTYTKTGRYTVAATSYWVVDWTGLGQTGQIPLNLTQTAAITMGEVQVINK